MKITAFYSGIKRNPRETLCGSKTKIVVSLPFGDTHNLESEECLENVIKSVPSIPAGPGAITEDQDHPSDINDQPIDGPHFL